MVRKEDVDYYSGFSRKELQSFCKRYNLPANRSSSDMVESLASYVEKNGINSVASTSRAPPSKKTWDVKRDSYGNKLDITRAREDCVQGAPYHQEQNGNGGLVDTSYQKKLNEKGPKENSKKDVFRRTDSSRTENRVKEVVDSADSPSSSSFEFHVSSEEGINLSVDLNFNPSDWIQSMRNEVNVNDSIHRRKSTRSGLDTNNTTECKKQKSSGQNKDKHVGRESSLSPVNKDNTHHSNGERTLASSAIEPCSRIKESSDIFQGSNGLHLSIPDSSGPGQIVSSCVESYSKSDSVMVATEQIHPAGDLLSEMPEIPSLQKVGNSSTVTLICPQGGGSELSSSEAEAYHSNPHCSPLKTSSYSEPFKFRYNGGKNCLPPNTEEQLSQEKSEILSEQARSE